MIYTIINYNVYQTSNKKYACCDNKAAYYILFVVLCLLEIGNLRIQCKYCYAQYIEYLNKLIEEEYKVNYSLMNCYI